MPPLPTSQTARERWGRGGQPAGDGEDGGGEDRPGAWQALYPRSHLCNEFLSIMNFISIMTGTLRYSVYCLSGVGFFHSHTNSEVIKIIKSTLQMKKETEA